MKTELIAMLVGVAIFVLGLAIGLVCGYWMTIGGLRKGASIVDNVRHDKSPLGDDEFTEDEIQVNTDGTYEEV